MISYAPMNGTIRRAAVKPGAEPSGRFVVRLDPGLHAALRAEAAARGTSLNALCSDLLADGRRGGCSEEFDAVVKSAVAVFDGDLVGVVAFGSWARGEATTVSDIDVLLVLAPSVAITRDIYRRWDRIASPTIERRVVDVHFVALPVDDERFSSLWAEVARDGIIAFDRDHRVSRYLGKVRRQLLGGHHRRAMAHGQPYWTVASQAVEP